MAIGAGVAALVACAFYLPRLSTGFASEDFLILAKLSRQGLLATLREELISPWLGLVAVGFWRPVSTFLLGLELSIFGLRPVFFHATHLLVHVFNACLVARVVAQAARNQWIAIAAAALFAMHPFHPSAVLFAGAFATLFGATFSLLAICWFLERGSSDGESSRDRLLDRRDLAAWSGFALALGCYEATIVVPAVLVVLALLAPLPLDRARQSPTRATSSALRRTVPFFAIAAVYLTARALILGASIGGYDAFRERYLGAPATLIAGFAGAVSRILHPSFEDGGRGAWAWTIGLAAALVVALLANARGTRGALAGLITMALFLAPFAFVGLVPANGRYAYLAIASAVLALSSLGAAIVLRWRGGTLIVAIAMIAMALDWLVPLRRWLDAYGAASTLIAAVRADTLAVSATHAAEGVVLFIDDPPDFIEGSSSEPIAKVLQYGLAESLRPPFGSAVRAPVPLPFAVSDAARSALDELPGTVRYRWDANAERLMPVGPAGPTPASTLDIESYSPSTGRLDARCADCDSTRLVLLTAALPIVIVPREKPAAGRASFEVSTDLLRGLAGLDDGSAFFWIEERGAGDGAPDATTISAIARFALAGDVVQGFAEAAAKIRRGSPGTSAHREDQR